MLSYNDSHGDGVAHIHDMPMIVRHEGAKEGL